MSNQIPEWGMLSIDQITSSNKAGRVGVLPICRSTWLQLVKKGFIPEGIAIIGNKKAWPVGVVRSVAERFAAGEFSGLNLWGKGESAA